MLTGISICVAMRPVASHQFSTRAFLPFCNPRSWAPSIIPKVTKGNFGSQALALNCRSNCRSCFTSAKYCSLQVLQSGMSWQSSSGVYMITDLLEPALHNGVINNWVTRSPARLAKALTISNRPFLRALTISSCSQWREYHFVYPK